MYYLSTNDTTATSLWITFILFNFFQKRSPGTIHLIVILFVISYALIGGAGFMYFEAQRTEIEHIEQEKHIESCIHNSLHSTSHIRRHVRAKVIYRGCVKPYIPISRWTYSNCVVFAFTIMATVGFGLVPSTSGGQVFFIIFALIGIPISMIVLANIGAFLKEAACKFVSWTKRRKEEKERDKNNRADEQKGKSFVTSESSQPLIEGEKTTASATQKVENQEVERKKPDDQPTDMTGSLLLPFFLGYVLFGAVLLFVLPDGGGSSGFVPSVFKMLFLVLIKLAFASVGLAIATIAIDVGSEYLKKLHNFGRKLRNAANVMVWFGAKKLSVRNLVKAVGNKCDVPNEKIDSLDLDELVESAIADSEKKQTKRETKQQLIELKPPDPVPEVRIPVPDPEPKPEIKTEPEVVPDPNGNDQTPPVVPEPEEPKKEEVVPEPQPPEEASPKPESQNLISVNKQKNRAPLENLLQPTKTKKAPDYSAEHAKVDRLTGGKGRVRRESGVSQASKKSAASAVSKQSSKSSTSAARSTTSDAGAKRPPAPPSRAKQKAQLPPTTRKK